MWIFHRRPCDKSDEQQLAPWMLPLSVVRQRTCRWRICEARWTVGILIFLTNSNHPVLFATNAMQKRKQTARAACCASSVTHTSTKANSWSTSRKFTMPTISPALHADRNSVLMPARRTAIFTVFGASIKWEFQSVAPVGKCIYYVHNMNPTNYPRFEWVEHLFGLNAAQNIKYFRPSQNNTIILAQVNMPQISGWSS